MRIDAAHRDARLLYCERAQRRLGRTQRADDARTGDQRERLADARVQRDVRDAQLAPGVREAEHQHALLRRQAAAARDKGGIAVEGEPGGMDGRFGMRRADHRVVVAGERPVDRRARRRERGVAMLRRHGADARRRVL